ncbi:stretch-activated cation channel mid1 [Ascosphaera pollenicola]|nr:stretch-activated cation channel mid1 [Ascosphaera pollenicola]
MSLMTIRLCSLIASTTLSLLTHFCPANVAASIHHGHAVRDLIVYTPPDFLGLQFPVFHDGSDGLSSIIAPRAPAGVQSLANNVPVKSNLKMGETQYYMVPKSVLSSSKQQSKGLPATGPVKRSRIGGGGAGLKHEVQQKQKTALYITATTCLQPQFKDSQKMMSDKDGAPQLSLFISTTQKPVNTDNAEKYVFEEGYANVTLYPDDDIYIGVQAPASKDRRGIYNYHIAASIDQNFHSVDASDPYLYFVDSDSTNALLWTDDMTSDANSNDSVFQEWMHLKPPYTMFAQDIRYRGQIAGLTHSHCGLAQNAVVNGRAFYDTKMTDKGAHRQPKQQFHVRGLNSSSWYSGYLSMDGNSTNSGAGVAGGGGKVWAPMFFYTKVENNTALLFDLDFCDEIAYAVPANRKFTTSQLGDKYDNQAKERFANFSKTMQVIPCDADPKGKYSLVSDCDDCKKAYKQWLCAVTIPRASDYSDTRPYLLPRNIKQKFPNGTALSSNTSDGLERWAYYSRNRMITRDIQPGPYKELPPCRDLCWEMTRTCPMALGIKCPEGADMNRSYGMRSDNGDVTCSFLGAAYFEGSARTVVEGVLTSLLMMSAFWILY